MSHFPEFCTPRHLAFCKGRLDATTTASSRIPTLIVVVQSSVQHVSASQLARASRLTPVCATSTSRSRGRCLRAGVDATTKAMVQKLPMLSVRAGPRDGEDWIKRMKEELMALITYQKVNKEAGNEWFTIESNKTGTHWTGKVWYVHEMLRYEFDLEFELPVAYPIVRSWRSATSPRTAGTDLCSHICTCPLPLRRGHVSAGSPGAGVARAGRQDREDVPRRQDLPGRALQTTVGTQRAALRHRTRDGARGVRLRVRG